MGNRRLPPSLASPSLHVREGPSTLDLAQTSAPAPREEANRNPLEALVLAAGLSTRIRDAAGDLPKPLLPINEDPVLVRNLRWLAESGVSRATINLHYHADTVRAAILAASIPRAMDVRFLEEAVLLGTAGTARRFLSDAANTAPGKPPLLVVYGDSLVRLDLAALHATHLRSGARVTVALFDPSTAPHTGIAGGRVRIDADGRIRDFAEGGVAEHEWVNAGVYLVACDIFTRHAFADDPLDFGRDVFPRLLEKGERLQGHDLGPATPALRGGGYCLGLDTPAALRRARARVAAGGVELA